MKVEVKGGSPVEVSDAVFGCEYNEGLVHQLVTAHMAAGRQGSKAQLTRAEVRGGGAKPWKQKGTGRARAGTSRGPLWRSGGVTFAADTRDFSQKLNKKMYRKGIKVILSELIRKDRFVLAKEINLPAAKTKELITYLKTMELEKVLIVSVEENRNLYLASRNLHKVAVCDYKHIDPVSLLAYDKVLFTVDALKKIEGDLA
ncbi:MAG: 50S ribosomal protein L4 [Gammaproteobacteria bacterium RIFCSPHIGHO2_12_FULL_36_30]|nr:MAG: 50S ribosomal protein L4 [Gammaproteobacteria bacterium RIFCSPHIGHO2_12_FULL_36_30]